MRTLFCMCLLALHVSTPRVLWAQATGTLTGQAIDATTQEPLLGVAVQLVDTGLGGLSNAGGHFVISAEALNELQGPNAESIALINQVREKAGLGPATLPQLSSKEALRDHILAERSWEFFSEGLRRMDLIRHERFIEMAQQRGKAAQPHHVLFPIPQDEIDKNPSLQQNPGY